MSATVDTSEMKLIHNVIRRQVGRLPELFRRVSGRPPSAAVVAEHAKEMLGLLRVHHDGEDRLLYPLLVRRVAMAQDLIDRMESQHGEVAAMISAVETELTSWGITAEASAGERMASAIEAGWQTLTDHLDDEEQRVLPLASAHLSQAEWDALGKDGFGHIAPKRRLVVLGYILDGPSPTEAERFLKKNVPPPARVAFKVVGQRQYTHEVSKLGAV